MTDHLTFISALQVFREVPIHYYFIWFSQQPGKIVRSDTVATQDIKDLRFKEVMWPNQWERENLLGPHSCGLSNGPRWGAFQGWKRTMKSSGWITLFTDHPVKLHGCQAHIEFLRESSPESRSLDAHLYINSLKNKDKTIWYFRAQC